MIRQEDLPQQVPFEDQEEILEVTQEVVEEDFPMEEEEDHQAGGTREEAIITTTTMEEDQISWWETLQKYSKEYERKLSLSLLFGGSTQALTARTPPSPMRTRRASYSSRTFKGTMWPNGSNQ